MKHNARTTNAPAMVDTTEEQIQNTRGRSSSTDGHVSCCFGRVAVLGTRVVVIGITEFGRATLHHFSYLGKTIFNPITSIPY
jgi:hypothetical protein